MFEHGALILFAALLADWFFGEPEQLWRRLPHPVVLFGRAVGIADRRFNRPDDPAPLRIKKGAAAIVVLMVGVALLGYLLERLFFTLGWLGIAFEVFTVFALTAQKSMIDHAKAVIGGFQAAGLAGARKKVALIVGRDPEALDRSGVARATIESLAENFSDGVMAPAFWYLIFGLPGLFAYKMINTADSMIGHLSARHREFGRIAAEVDDLANWLPARLSVAALALGARVSFGADAARRALDIARRDGGLHASPNAGRPEAAMAGALDIALGGPRCYDGRIVAQAYINAGGRQELDIADIAAGITVFAGACRALMGVVLLLALVCAGLGR